MRRAALFFATCLLIASASARAETPDEAVRAMVAAEKKFYETGQEKGTRAAFGYDTGPAKWRAKKTDPTFTGYGHFISIWKKQGDGSWKVALDCGIENTKSDVKPPLQLVPPKKRGQGTLESLQQTQSAFIATARLDFTKAFRQFGSDKVRLYRDGSFPMVGKKEAVELLGSEQAGVAMEVTKSDMSSSGDLAYSYGGCTDNRTQPGRAGHFLQICKPTTRARGSWCSTGSSRCRSSNNPDTL